MATETIEIADVLEAVPYAFGHRPAYGFLIEPPPAPSVVEHFLMNAQRTDGSHVTWVHTAPDPSGASAPGGAPLVAASILLVKRGLFY